jgi:capsular polysaccharide biosynthesis protein
MGSTPQMDQLLSEQKGDDKIRDEAIEISLMQILDFMQRHWKVLAASMLIFLLGAALLLVLLPTKWRASALIEIGQRSGSLIESPAQVTEKLKQISMEGTFSSADPLKAVLVKNTNLIRITAFGFSSREAEEMLNTIASKLLQEHSNVSQSRIDRLTEKLQEYNLQIAGVGSELAKLEAMVISKDNKASDNNISASILAFGVLNNKRAELWRLIEARAAIEDELASKATFDTRVVGEIDAQSTPYYPRADLFLMAGALLGLVVGIAIALYKEYRRTTHAKAIGA